jgi:hypothetical protein
MNGNSTDHGPDSVDITENMGEWFVRVVREGKAHALSFEPEAYARAYAEGQRVGLGLPAIGQDGATQNG